MPPYALFSDDSPNLDGSIFRSARASSREIMIPVFLFGIDRRTVNQLKRQLFQALNPARGYCVLTFTEGDGRSRKLSCYYKGGMEGAEDSSTAGFTWAKYGLTFTAMDPWFYSDRDESKRWDFGAGDPFLSPVTSFFPVKISSGVLGGDGQGLAINNPGDIEAWPVWELRGPIKSFSLTSPYGESIAAAPPSDGSDLVASGRRLIIDTRPGRKTVKDSTGTNYWDRLSSNPQFWSIDPGESSADISVVTGSGKAAVTLSFSPRYASYV
ncbi:phage tail domain-containing protein [Streptomyces sp. PDY-4]|uniref:phage tail domain-containing protein n=1 Tax=Streptomyces sp. PDY-4 TaxID=3376070 RepID=UPI003791675B